MKFIIYPQLNNKLALVIPAVNSSIEDLVKTVVPFQTPYKIIDNLSIDNDFFDAYDYSDEGPVINVDRAKEIQLNKFRFARKPLLEKLDVLYMKALEINDTTSIESIVKQKQDLRNVTNTFLPNDLEGIKNTWPSILN